MKNVFGGRGEADVCCAIAAPASRDGEKDARKFGDESLLLGGVEHQVAVALLDRSERREDAAADAEVRSAHVGAFLSTCETQSDTAKVARVHGWSLRDMQQLWHTPSDGR